MRAFLFPEVSLRRKWGLLLATTILVVVLPGFVGAAWNRVQLADGTQVCQDDATKAQFKPPYAAKADVTKACNTLTTFWPWLGTAAAQVIRTHCLTNPDNSCSTAYPLDNKSPTTASVAWDDSCLATALAIISNQSTGTATSIDIGPSTCLTGTNKASATITIDAASSATNWSIASNHLLTHAGVIAGSGSIILRATYLAEHTVSNSYPWAYQAPPGTDTLAPPIPTDIRTTGGTNQVVISGDTPWDTCGSSNCKGTQDIQIQADGSGTLTTISVGPGFSCNPTLTNLGSMATAPSLSQSGNDWTVAGAGTMDGSADAYAFMNCAFTGAGYVTVIFPAFSSTTAYYQKQVIARRASQTAQGSIAIIGGVLRASAGDGGGDYVFLDARSAPDDGRFHIISGAAITLPACGKLEWDANNVHTFSTATMTGGKCNNDWTAQNSPYTISMPSTTYVGLGVSSGAGSSGANLSAAFTQLNINNQARWSYTHSTSSSHTYAARARDKQGTPNASAYSATKAGSPTASGSTGVRWHPGYYTDCTTWLRHGNDFSYYLGGDVDTDVRSCIDWSATQTNVRGVFITPFWSAFEGDTAGSYDGSVGNSLASAGKIGYPLWDSLLAYAASKGMKVILEIDWFNYYNDINCAATDPNDEYAGYFIRGLIPKYLLSPSCGGTDSSNTYSGAYYSPGHLGDNTFYLKLWKPAVMTRFIAMLNAYAARYDTNSALEMILLYGQEGDSRITPADGSIDGYTYASLDGQFQRVVSEVKPNWPHTQITFAGAWMRGMLPSMQEAITSQTKAIGAETNNALTYSSFAEGYYLGLPLFGNTTGHDFSSELPYTDWIATEDEICPAKGGHTPAEWYAYFFTNGKTDAGGRTLRPNYWILNAYKIGLAYCPSDASANWGTIGGSGWYNFIQTHPTRSTCPTNFLGGCNTN